MKNVLKRCISLVTLMFFTFETLFIFSIIYFLSIPFSIFTYFKNKQSIKDNSDEEHEDVL